jgi:hypothetical protein
MIVPIITYGSEVWISDFKSNFDTLDKIQFEKRQNMILKNILGVHGKSSNLATRYGLGTLFCFLFFFCFHQYYLILAVSIIGKRCLFLFIVTSLAVRQKK